MEKIQRLNLVAYPTTEKNDKDRSELDSALWYSSTNVCEFNEPLNCITEHGLYFGTSDEREPKFCPFHYFQNTGYTIEPIKA